MVRGQTLLFELVVEHGYFVRPGDCRLRFRPDAASAAWMRRADATLRVGPNTLRLFCASERAPGVGKSVPATLDFWVSAEDPLFGFYTGGFDMTPEMMGASDVDRTGPVFDLGFVSADADGVLVAAPWVAACPLDAGPSRPARQGFRVSVPLAPPVRQAPAYCIRLAPRAVVWKYLLAKDAWDMDAPRLAERDDRTVSSTLDPVGFSPGPAEPLADGRTALTFLSDEPLPLADRSPRRVAMWAGAGVNSGRIIVPVLPNPSAANLARAGPGAGRLVAEILVPR